jgi:hypothetical protein
MDTAARLCITEPAYKYCRAFMSILQKAYFGAAESSYGYCRKFALLQNVYMNIAKRLCGNCRIFV